MKLSENRCFIGFASGCGMARCLGVYSHGFILVASISGVIVRATFLFYGYGEAYGGTALFAIVPYTFLFQTF